MKPIASIVITTYNSASFIKPTVESALDQDFDPKKYEVVIIDDGSKDKTVYILREYQNKHKNLRIIAQRNEGPALARTKAIKEAKGKYVLMMSHDCLASKSWVTDVVKIFEKNSKIGMVQGKLLPSEPINLPVYHCNNFASFRVTFDTAEIAYRAEALDKVGRYFDQQFSANGDDADIAWRILESGYLFKWVDKTLMHHIILPRRFSADLKSLPNMRLFPYLIKIHPGMRNYLPYHLFWGSKFKYLPLAALVITLLLSLIGLWTWGVSIIVLILLFNLYRVLRSTHDHNIKLWQKILITYPHRLLFDSLLGLYLILGSMKYRSLIL